MRRASIERQRTVREWRNRLEMDATLEPGRFRKGRTARGCPHFCGHCKAQKAAPTLHEIRSRISLAEEIELLQ